MKSNFTIALLFAGISAAAPCGAAPQMRDAATHDQLALQYRKASQEDPMRRFKPVKGSDPTLENQPEDFVASSDIISFGGNTTFVPKRAILNLPPKLAERIKYVPGTKIMTWPQFYALNRGWITTVEVSRTQAEGNKALAEEIADRVKKSSNLVVATLQGGPISVLPLKVPDEAAETGKTAKAN